jgi:hypothetical protein
MAGRGDFTKYYSRYFAGLDGRKPSALCAADKLATTIVPKSLYLALIHLSGEVEEYLEHFREALNSSSGKYALEALNVPSAAYKYGSSSIGTRLRCWATSVGSLDTRAGFILSNNLKLPGQ